MKKLLYMSVLLLVSALFIFACSSGGGGAASFLPPPPVNYSAYPTGPDSVITDATFTGATTVTLGTSYHRTLYPDGDVDFFKVHLVSGPALTYEFSANQMSVNSDTYMFLYDTDGTTLLLENDDCLDFDSCIQFKPAVDGDYYIEVMSYEHAYWGIPSGVLSYTFNAHLFVDNDADNIFTIGTNMGSPTFEPGRNGSSYYDCNDTDATIYPGAPETPGDGISQNCSGVDALVDTVADSAEPDNTKAQARTLTLLDANPWEIIYRHDLFAQYGRTLAPADDIDWFAVTVPAYAQVEVGTATYYRTDGFTLTWYDSDGITVLDTNTDVIYLTNMTATAKKYYVTFQSDGPNADDTAYYVPYAMSYGTDKDGDGYYSRDWDISRDCNDNDDTVLPGPGPGAGCGYGY